MTPSLLLIVPYSSATSLLVISLITVVASPALTIVIISPALTVVIISPARLLLSLMILSLVLVSILSGCLSWLRFLAWEGF